MVVGAGCIPRQHVALAVMALVVSALPCGLGAHVRRDLPISFPTASTLTTAAPSAIPSTSATATSLPGFSRLTVHFTSTPDSGLVYVGGTAEVTSYVQYKSTAGSLEAIARICWADQRCLAFTYNTATASAVLHRYAQHCHLPCLHVHYSHGHCSSAPVCTALSPALPSRTLSPRPLQFCIGMHSTVTQAYCFGLFLRGILWLR